MDESNLVLLKKAQSFEVYSGIRHVSTFVEKDCIVLQKNRIQKSGMKPVIFVIGGKRDNSLH